MLFFFRFHVKLFPFITDNVTLVLCKHFWGAQSMTKMECFSLFNVPFCRDLYVLLQ